MRYLAFNAGCSAYRRHRHAATAATATTAAITIIAIAVATIAATTTAAVANTTATNTAITTVTGHHHRRCRCASFRVDAAVTYGTHMALAQATTLLFLQGGLATLRRDDTAIAALLAAFFPRYPASAADNRYHLQVGNGVIYLK
jgi:hypothetical protein